MALAVICLCFEFADDLAFQEASTLVAIAVWETKFLEHLPQNRCLLYVLCKISLTQGNFLLAQLNSLAPGKFEQNLR